MTEEPPKERKVVVNMARRDTSELRRIGGSDRDVFNNFLIAQAIDAQWVPSVGLTDEQRVTLGEAVCTAMMGFGPADAIEGMLAAQAAALHGMVMENMRKARLVDQPHEIAQGLRKSAISASRMFTEIIGAMDRKRGRHRQQTVRVERVTVAPGGQAVVGVVNAGGAGGHAGQIEGEPHAPPAALAHHPALSAGVPPVRRQDPSGNAMPRTSNEG